MDEWINQYNDYDCLQVYDGTGTLSHYCSAGNLVKILESKYFWAQDISTFDDPNEGIAVLDYLSNNLGTLFATEEERGLIQNEIVKVQSFARCFVTCFCLDENSHYMFEEFHNKNSSYIGCTCEIVFDGDALMNSILFHDHQRNGEIIEKKNNYVKKKYIVYSDSQWKKIIDDEIAVLYPLLRKEDSGLNLQQTAEKLVRKLYFLGTYFKVPCKENSVSAKEKEVRFLADIYEQYVRLDDAAIEGGFVQAYTEGDRKVIHFHYDLGTILRIRTKNSDIYKKVKEELENAKINQDVKEYLLKSLCIRA